MFGRISTRLTIFGICLAAGCGDAGGRSNLADDAESTRNYAAWVYDGEGMAVIDDDLPGLILMRDESDMTALGGSRFDDGLGNLVVRGTFVVAAAGESESDYALTFLGQGGVQLALDLHRDRVVDAVFDITPEGHFGVLGDLALENGDRLHRATDDGRRRSPRGDRGLLRTGSESGRRGRRVVQRRPDWKRVRPTCRAGLRRFRTWERHAQHGGHGVY